MVPHRTSRLLTPSRRQPSAHLPRGVARDKGVVQGDTGALVVMGFHVHSHAGFGNHDNAAVCYRVAVAAVLIGIEADPRSIGDADVLVDDSPKNLGVAANVGPRQPRSVSLSLPAADVNVLGNGTIAGDDGPSLCRLPDTAGPHAAVTRAALLGRRLRYSTVREDEGEGTTSRTPSTNRSAYDNGQVLAAAAKTDHAGPRT